MPATGGGVGTVINYKVMFEDFKIYRHIIRPPSLPTPASDAYVKQKHLNPV